VPHPCPRVITRGALVAAAATALLAASAMAASAHPLGNATVNQYSGLRLGEDRIVVDHVLDEAELPTLQTIQSISGGGTLAAAVTPAERDSYRTRTCASRAGRLTLTVDGRAVPLTVDSSMLGFLPGVAGLSTLRLTCTLSAPASLGSGDHDVSLRTANDEGNLGWREMTAVGDHTTLTSSSVPTTSLSDRLRAYPANLLSSPDDTRSADLRVRPGGPAATPLGGEKPFLGVQTRGIDVLSRKFQGLVAGKFTLAAALLALLLSLVLGGAHALSPGHGKTIMAAFLVGQRGRWKQVGIIGVTVTVTHTIGVLILGLILYATSTAIGPSLYPLLGVLSGVLVIGLGLGLLRTRYRAGRALVAAGHRHDGDEVVVHGAAAADHDHDHAHGHGHDHPHGDRDHGHDHPHEDHAHGGLPGPRGGGTALATAPAPTAPAAVAVTEQVEPDVTVTRTDEGTVIRHRHGARVHTHVVPTITADGRVRMPSLVGMGLADGLVPSPSALVVLLSALALGRAWFGVLLVVGYGVGMAITLIGVGLLLGRFRGRLERADRVRGAMAVLPVLTSVVIVGVGCYLAGRGLLQLARV